MSCAHKKLLTWSSAHLLLLPLTYLWLLAPPTGIQYLCPTREEAVWDMRGGQCSGGHVLWSSCCPCSSCGPGVAAGLCRVTGGILGIHWSSTVGLGWHPLARGTSGATCWEACCLNPSCGATWSLGGRCVLLTCSRRGGCPISSLPQPHEESLGLLQLLSKVRTNGLLRCCCCCYYLIIINILLM